MAQASLRRFRASSSVTFEYHDEDYCRDYRWTEPAAYVVCRDCHIYRIHQRFRHPDAWTVFLAHVARDGYARDMRLAEAQKELAPRNTGMRPIGGTWFSLLTCGVSHMSDPEHRPRP